MNHVNRFETITKTATSVSHSWTNKEVVMFHYFNPNGLIAAKRIVDDQISQLVDSGKAKSGAIIAYGSLNFFNYDNLAKLLNKKAVRSIDLAVTIRGLKSDLERAKEYVAEKSAE